MKNKLILIKNAWICEIESESVNPTFGNLIIENGLITKIISADDSPSKKDFDVIDAQGKVLTAPNVNFHDHVYSRLAKGLPFTGSMANFPEMLQNLWWKLDLLLNHEMIKASAYMAAMESIRNGVTYIFDHHASPSHTLGSLKCIKEALKEFNVKDTDKDSKALIGLHASFTIDDSTLESVKKFLYKNNVGIHIHICEDESDRSSSLKRYGKSPVQRLLDYNLVNEKSILVHGVHITKTEFALLKDKKTALAINLDSNLNNSVGTPIFENIPEEI